jgi:hypothetical protein
MQSIIIVLIYFTGNIHSFLYFSYRVKQQSKNWMFSASFLVLYWVLDLPDRNLRIGIIFYIQIKL